MNKDDHFIIGDIQLTMFDMMQQLGGTEVLLVDMAEGKPYLEPLMDKCAAFALAVGKCLISFGVDGVWSGDDFGAQNGILISPRMWRRYFKDRYARIYTELKSVNLNVIVMQHCDGAVAPILCDWIEGGMDADIQAKIEVLGQGGGYMVSPAHIIQSDTPVQNVEAMIAAVKKHGLYSEA